MYLFADEDIFLKLYKTLKNMSISNKCIFPHRFGSEAKMVSYILSIPKQEKWSNVFRHTMMQSGLCVVHKTDTLLVVQEVAMGVLQCGVLQTRRQPQENSY